MRYMGVVEWYGGTNNSGRNNDFGEIFCHHLIKVYKRDLGLIENLNEGEYVTFEVKEVNGKQKAINIKLLKDEEDIGLICKVLNGAYASAIWNKGSMGNIIKKYVSTLTINEIIELFTKVTRRYTSIDKVKVLKNKLPYQEMWLMDDGIKRLFSTEEAITILSSLLSTEKYTDNSDILVMLKDNLAKSNNTPKQHDLPTKNKVRDLDAKCKNPIFKQSQNVKKHSIEEQDVNKGRVKSNHHEETNGNSQGNYYPSGPNSHWPKHMEGPYGSRYRK